jgi:hypothetical protein
MWVINRYATLVVDMPDDMDEADADDAITEHISQNLYDGGEMHELFGRERKIGDSEAGDTVIDHIKDASPDAKPDLRLRYVEDDDGEYVTVEFVREHQHPQPSKVPLRKWTDSRTKYEPLVEKLSDDDLCDLVAVVHRRLCIPNWFTREHLKGIAGQDASAHEWGGFLEWLDDTRIPDYLSEQLREWWGDYRQYKQNQEDEQ